MPSVAGNLMPSVTLIPPSMHANHTSPTRQRAKKKKNYLEFELGRQEAGEAE